MKFWQRQEFKTLQKLWYERLKEAGFHDAEKLLGSEPVLIQNAPNTYRQAAKIIREAKEKYYTTLSQHVEAEAFEPSYHALIMRARANGEKIKHICELLKSQDLPCHRQTIRFIIRHYEQKWGLKNWSQADLNPPWRRWRKTHTK